jgi:hypothetical protein
MRGKSREKPGKAHPERAAARDTVYRKLRNLAAQRTASIQRNDRWP